MNFFFNGIRRTLTMNVVRRYLAVSASLLLLLRCVPAACADDTNPTTAAIAALRNNPDDKALLAKLKTSLTSLTNLEERCAPGVLYCMGCLSAGAILEGQTIRTQLLKAYPGNLQMIDLADSNITEPCSKCIAGKTAIACAHCNGTGRCPTCNGKGHIAAAGFHSPPQCLGCGGTGKCHDCGGTGRVQGICSACGGHGTVLSQTKCQQAYLRLLQPTGTTHPFLGDGNNKSVVAASQVASTTTQSKYSIPVVAPPVAGPVDPEVKEIFDAKMREYFLGQIQWLEKNDQKGWSYIGAPPADKQRIIEQERALRLSAHPGLAEEMWSKATWTVAKRRSDEARKQAEAERVKAEEDKRVREAQAQQEAQAVSEQAVKAALDRVTVQIAQSKLLTKYLITSNDIDRTRSPKYTTVQRDSAFSELWDRALPTPAAKNIRALFAPIPNGLKYVIHDVTSNKKGNYVIRLDMDKGELPSGMERKLAATLGLSSLTRIILLVPGDDPEVANLSKKQSITSDAWFIPIILDSSKGKAYVDRAESFRSEAEFSRLILDSLEL